MSRKFSMNYKQYDTSNGFGSASEWRSAFRKRMTGQEADVILSRTKETPETILGVSSSATLQEIKKAFRVKIAEWHPDRNQSPDAEEMSKKIIAAYTKLSEKWMK